MVAVVFIIPFSGLLLFYVRILVRIKHIEGQLSIHDKVHNRTLWNVAVMVITVLFTTVICWAPITTYWFIKYLPKDQRSHEVQTHPKFGYSDEFRYIGETFIFLHCAIQPIIYFLTGSKLRREMIKWVPCIKMKVG